MGSLFKQIYRYTRPRAYRHNENLWPFTRITRAPSGEISALRYKGKTVPLVSLSALKNSMQGEVLLTATGPSTRNIDFSLLSKTIPVMGVNGAWHLADRLHFSLYTIVDMEFFDKKPDIIRAIVSQPDILLFTTMHGIAKIVDRHADALRCRLACAAGTVPREARATLRWRVRAWPPAPCNRQASVRAGAPWPLPAGRAPARTRAVPRA